MTISIASLWAVAGLVLCTVELVLPTAFVAFAMGLAALLTALVALVLPWPGALVLIWLLASTLLVFGFKRWMRQRSRRSPTLDAVQAKTLTAIAPGQSGRVLYEGCSWAARCDAGVTIGAEQEVYVVRREGTTLVVIPTDLPDS